MNTIYTQELINRARHRGLSSADGLMIAVAILVGWNEHRGPVKGDAVFSALASQLPMIANSDGSAAAREWLEGHGLRSYEWEFVDDGLNFLQSNVTGPIDWNAEVAYCLHSDRHSGIHAPSMPLAKALARLLDVPLQQSVACLFASSAPLAWVLADDRDVTLHADSTMAAMMALFARAARKPLKVRRDNPVDGTFLPASLSHTGMDREPTLAMYDHVVSVPPFGIRVQQGPSKGLGFESYHVERLASYARRSFSVLLPDGALFREAKAEVEFRTNLVTNYRTTVMSLPSGMLWPAAAVSTSLLRLERETNNGAMLVDARSMEKTSTGRVQEGLVVQHLEQFRGLRANDQEKEIFVPIDQLSANGFSLLPDRYLKSADVAAMEEALDRRTVVTLADIATIERGKAPVPLRDPEDTAPLTALEIAPSDLVDGIVRPPRKRQAFDLKEKSRVEGVTVRAGDILVSIKGNVGIVGMIDDATDGLRILAEINEEPWTISQSLAIVRLQPNSPVSSPAVLNALLTAPWVREKLESMSGASTVRTLPISALRTFQLPLPTAEEIDRAESQLADIGMVREQIDKHQQNLAEHQKKLWTQLWHMPIDLGDE